MRPTRPAVSVVVPFVGGGEDLTDLLRRLCELRTRPGDQLIVADNRPAGGAPTAYAVGPVSVIPAAGIRSPAFARNRGAAQTRGEWLLFIDADTEPDPDLIDRYFDPPPADDVAVLVGAIIDVPPSDPGLAARHAVARRQMSAATTADRSAFSYAQSANCAVRRSAFIAAGGFEALARAGEDADLCFRLGAAGYRMEYRPAARVGHRARSGLRALLAQLATHGAGAAWCERRHPGSFPPSVPRQFAARLARSAADGVRELLGGDRERASFAVIEIAEACAFQSGRALSNRARTGP